MRTFFLPQIFIFIIGLSLSGLAHGAEKLKADGRPDESSMFGDSKPEAPKSETTAASELDSKALDASKTGHNAFSSGEVTDNPLQIGGIFYQRFVVSAQQGTAIENTPIAAPMQFDLYLDSRPSERVRGFVDQRIIYDATRDQNGNTTSGANLASLQNSSSSAGPSLSTSASQLPNNPQTVLDQAWLKFDIDSAVFVTVGKQHIKWGTSRFWNPTDFLSTQRRDPLLPYDLRLGNTMVKLDIPWESKKTNFYAITLFDNPGPASTLGSLGEAFRVETLIAGAEVGLDAVFRGRASPLFGADISTPIGPFDFYAEASYLTSVANPNYQLNSNGVTPGADVSSLYSTTNVAVPAVPATAGLRYTFAWKENRSSTIGIEYFSNPIGYSNANIYPVLIFLKKYQPFFTGQNYAALYITAEGPDSEKHTSYTFSTLANLSDSSFISRIDFSWRFLTYLTFEAYIDDHYGTQGGDFNFSLNTPTLTAQGIPIAAISLPPTTVDVGAALRLSF